MVSFNVDGTITITKNGRLVQHITDVRVCKKMEQQFHEWFGSWGKKNGK